jgi:uncharacterized membrane protein
VLFTLALLVSMVAFGLSLIAILAVNARRGAEGGAESRLAALEEQVRWLAARVRLLEGMGRSPAAPAPPAPVAAPPIPVSPPVVVEPAPLAAASPVPAPPIVEPSPATRPTLDLEQRIGARWATWVGIVVILVAVGLFLKWAFDNEYLGPAMRVSIGVVGGLLMVGGGLALHRRSDVPYLSEGLAGGGLGWLYLSLFAAHALYGLLGPATAFASMFAVTLLGALVAVLTNRLSTAVLAVLGGLLTPILLQVERPDERNLLAYLLVLDVLALLVARFRAWAPLQWLAWAGTALLVLLALSRETEPARPLARLVLLSAIFLVFVAVPIFRERALRQRVAPVDLTLVVANAAAYFWAVYVTLEPWRPAAEGPYAVALAVLYQLVATDYASRVPEDHVTVVVHEGVSWTFLTLAIPLWLDTQWVTLAWAIQGVMLLWLASRAPSAVATWGGLVALLLAGFRAVALDRYWSPESVPVWNLIFLIHLLVVVALSIGGGLAGRLQVDAAGRVGPESVRATLWVAAAVTLAVLLWREPPALWPATLLTLELLTIASLVRVSASPAFVIAAPLIVAVLAARVLGADDELARSAADSLVSTPLFSRVGACLAIALAGGQLTRVPRPSAQLLGRILSGGAGLILLFVLSVNWTRYQDGLQAAARAAGRIQTVAAIRWRTQVGLSVLWSFYAGVALAWGFLRAYPAVRYAALGLLGVTVFKVFAVDLAAVKTVYRILSFLVLGVVLLLVSLAYQKLRAPKL